VQESAMQNDIAETNVQSLLQQEQPPFLADAEPDRIRLDVRRVNAMQLEALGIASEQMAIAPHCTFQDPKRFFSYRRDGEKKVQWSGIVSGTQ
ncbi:MAG: laccase domain-containing protein, partial [Cyanobacteria bacterium P01_F01_bin.42]